MLLDSIARPTVAQRAAEAANMSFFILSYFLSSLNSFSVTRLYSRVDSQIDVARFDEIHPEGTLTPREYIILPNEHPYYTLSCCHFATSLRKIFPRTGDAGWGDVCLTLDFIGWN